MGRKTKYVKGGYIHTVSDLRTAIANRQWLYHGEKPLHPQWLHCMSLEYLEKAIGSGKIRIAVERDSLVEVVCEHAAECAARNPLCTGRVPHLPTAEWGSHEALLCWELHLCERERRLCRCVPVDGVWPEHMADYNKALTAAAGES
jgi:hypothetical protein